MTSHSGPVTVAVVGAGQRSKAYTQYAIDHPERMRVVAVADPNPVHRRIISEKHGIPAELQFESYEQLAARPPVAEAVINATRDQLHHKSALPLLAAGYHMLLEKPIAHTEAEVRGIIGAAKQHGRKVVIGHVLRFAPFYSTIKRMLLDGRIGGIVSLNTLEAVSYHHMATGYVRDRWNRRDKNSPMLLAKCCHDLDVIGWLMSGVPARRVSSFGSLKHFRAENAPAGSGTRCVVDCRIERECVYSARRLYVEKSRWRGYVFQPLQGRGEVTDEMRMEHLRESPYGRCVWRCDNDVVDHQSVLVEFAGGATATHDMFCATARPTRQIHIIGTKGEIQGDMEDGVVRLRHPDLRPGPNDCVEETVNVNEAVGGDGAGHGGGDVRLIADFVAVVRGEPASISTTSIEDSLTGHLIAFAADTAMLERRVVEIPEA